MTMQQLRFSGPHPIVREAVKKDRTCTVATQALCRGELDWRVQGVTGAAARKGKAHIALRYGRVLLYLEDMAALDALVDAVEAVYDLREEVFGAHHDLPAAARAGRSSFERDGQPAIGGGSCIAHGGGRLRLSPAQTTIGNTLGEMPKMNSADAIGSWADGCCISKTKGAKSTPVGETRV
jgi:hypothetical protein